jgi:hypothetical protein
MTNLSKRTKGRDDDCIGTIYVHGTSLSFEQVWKRCRPRLHVCNDGRHSTEQALSTFVYKVTEELLCHDLILRSRASIYVHINNITRIKVYKN